MIVIVEKVNVRYFENKHCAMWSQLLVLMRESLNFIVFWVMHGIGTTHLVMHCVSVESVVLCCNYWFDVSECWLVGNSVAVSACMRLEW